MRGDFPYRIHTNFELGMMLRGEKPLARFSRELDPPVPTMERYYRMFDRHVESGRFLREEHPFLFDNRKLLRLFYVLPGEEWRIDAMIELLEDGGRWTLDHERREGELLGYADWQNDYWIEANIHDLPPG